MEHFNDIADYLLLIFRDLQPVVEGLNQLGANLLASALQNVVVRLQKLLFLKRVTADD